MNSNMTNKKLHQHTNITNISCFYTYLYYSYFYEEHLTIKLKDDNYEKNFKDLKNVI